MSTPSRSPSGASISSPSGASISSPSGASISRARADAVVVGGGHNGLVAAGFLAKAGLRPIVLEARDVVGGAAVTEQPWGPGWNVTSLSYVMSLMPDAIVRGLDLYRHGYTRVPDGPLVSRAARRARPRHGRGRAGPLRVGGRVLQARRRSRSQRWDAWLAGIAEVLGPLLTTVPPKLGSKRPGDLAAQAKLAWRLRGLDVGSASDVTRLFAMSIGDVLREWFETDAVQAMMAVNGIIGTWAGPEEPGTAYVMLHHSIGDVGAGSGLGAWGYPRGGMGAVSEALRRAADRRSVPPSAPAPRSSGCARATAPSSAWRSPTATRSTPTSSSPRSTRRSASSGTSTPASCPTTS